MLTLPFHISRPFNMKFLQLIPKIKGTAHVQTNLTLFDVDGLCEILHCTGEHSLVRTNTQGGRFSPQGQTGCPGWRAPQAPSPYLNVCFLSRALDVGLLVRSHRWIRQASWNTALVLPSCRNSSSLFKNHSRKRPRKKAGVCVF